MDFKRNINEYLLFLSVEKGLSRAAISSYRQDLKRHQGFLEDRGMHDYRAVATALISSLPKRLKEEGKSAKTITRMQSTLRNYPQSLLNEDVVKTNPATSLHIVKEDKKLPVYLTVQEMEILLRTPDGSTAGT